MAAWPMLMPPSFGGTLLVDEDVEPGRGERALDDLGEPHVLEHPAGEGDRVDAVRRAPGRRPAPRRPGRSPRGSRRRAPPAASRAPRSATSRGDERRRVEHEPRRRRRATHDVAVVRRRVDAVDRSGQRLELDRGLRLVAHRGAGRRAARRPRRTAGPCSSSIGAGPRAARSSTAPTVAASTSASARATAPAAPSRPHRGHPPRLADGGHAARHRHRAQVADPLVARRGRPPAPRRPTACRRARSRARRRPGRARARCGRARPCTPRRGRGGAARRRSGRSRSSGELGRQVLGVEVVGDDLGRDAVERGRGGRPPGGTTGRSPGARGRRCGGWARRPRPLATAIGALQLGADGEHRPARRRTAAAAARARSPATGAAPAAGPRAARTTESSQRMWIGRSWVSRPSTMRPEPGDRVVVVVGDRLVAAGCRSSSPAGRPTPAQQQVVERAVRQHQAELGQARAPPHRRTVAAGPARREHDRPARRGRARRRPRRRARTARRPSPGRRPSPRTACRRGPCAGAARPRPSASVASTARW